MDMEVPGATSGGEILWGRPVTQTWHSRSLLGDPQSWTRVGICRCSGHAGPGSSSVTYFPAKWPLLFGLTWEDILTAYPGKVYLENQRKGSRMRMSIGFEFIQQVSTEHLPCTKHSALISQKATRLVVRPHWCLLASWAPRSRLGFCSPSGAARNTKL